MNAVVVVHRRRLDREGLTLLVRDVPGVSAAEGFATVDDAVAWGDGQRPGSLTLLLDYDDETVRRDVRKVAADIRIVGLSDHADVAGAGQALTWGVRMLVPSQGGPQSLALALRPTPLTSRRLPRAPTAVARLATLTPRERQVLDGLVAGERTRDTGQRLGIAPKTVENIRQRLYARLAVQGASQAVAVLQQHRADALR